LTDGRLIQTFAGRAEERSEDIVNSPISGRCSIVGLHPEEMEWVRLLVTLLRDPDPLTAEMARQAVDYVRQTAEAGIAQERRSATRV